METEKTTTPKLRPFAVMDQQIAHRLAMEGFELINAVPSNKYAAEAHFIFTFNGTAAFKKRFNIIREEVESETARIASEKEKEAEEIERIKAENAELKAKISEVFCEKSSENTQKNAENIQINAEKTQKNAENMQENEENSQITIKNSDVDKILDKLAELQATGNCILSNIAAANFYTSFHNQNRGRNKN